METEFRSKLTWSLVFEKSNSPQKLHRNRIFAQNWHGNQISLKIGRKLGENWSFT